jgi:hypothetical protein
MPAITHEKGPFMINISTRRGPILLSFEVIDQLDGSMYLLRSTTLLIMAVKSSKETDGVWHTSWKVLKVIPISAALYDFNDDDCYAP